MFESRELLFSSMQTYNHRTELHTWIHWHFIDIPIAISSPWGEFMHIMQRIVQAEMQPSPDSLYLLLCSGAAKGFEPTTPGTSTISLST